MFDIGWTELLVIAVVLIVVVGPKDLPPMLRAFGKMTTRARKVAGEFRAQFDEALREADLDDVRQTIADAQKLNPMNTLREAMDPLRQMGHDIKADLQRSTTVDAPPAATPAVAVAEPAMSLRCCGCIRRCSDAGRNSDDCGGSACKAEGGSQAARGRSGRSGRGDRR